MLLILGIRYQVSIIIIYLQWLLLKSIDIVSLTNGNEKGGDLARELSCNLALFVVFVIFVINFSSNSSLECNRAQPVARLDFYVFFSLLIDNFFFISLNNPSLHHLHFSIFLDFSKISKINLKTKKEIRTDVFTTKFPQFVHAPAWIGFSKFMFI